MSLSITFLGGTGTVTGSKYLIETDGHRILVDCGLFQGYKLLRERNWAPFPVPPSSIDAVVLTHAHLDHSGYLPLLVKKGFAGPIISTHATLKLCELILPDSGHLMEADARYANERGFSKHKPALPLYDQEDARRALGSFRTVGFHDAVPVTRDCTATFRPAGHILGAATVELQCGGKRIVFSGDLGRYDDATMIDPEPVGAADYLIVESTYGDRLHDRTDPEEALEEVIARTARRGGSVIIPAFAVGRAQSLLYHLSQVRKRGRVPNLPIFLDSPMAINASTIFCDHIGEHRVSAEECQEACGIATYTRDVEESKRIDRDAMPKIIISASGMATGGRILHHLKHYAPDRRNTILLAGFQAGGTRGAALKAGARELKIHGEFVPVRAEVASLDMFSAHADQGELLRWLGGFAAPPRMTFVTHGELASSDAFRRSIQEKLGWTARVPEQGERAELA
ncbi:MAG: MBL fold metallo-hydrolase [Sphingomonas sp.]|nr:MBL fold metallo-hydrolase [Sphingomonas sp.]